MTLCFNDCLSFIRKKGGEVFFEREEANFYAHFALLAMYQHHILGFSHFDELHYALREMKRYVNINTLKEIRVPLHQHVQRKTSA